MPRQQVVLDNFVIKKGQSVSNWVEFRGTWSDVGVLTLYSPKEVTGTVFVVQLDCGNELACTMTYKGQDVKVSIPAKATNIPVPACMAMRVASDAPEAKDRVFHALVLLDM